MGRNIGIVWLKYLAIPFLDLNLDETYYIPEKRINFHEIYTYYVDKANYLLYNIKQNLFRRE